MLKLSHTIKTQIVINASAEDIWEAVVDFSSYSDWNPFITKILGKAQLGERPSVCIHPPGFPPREFSLLITQVVPQQKLRWLGHFYVPGLVDGDRTLTLTPILGNRTLVTQSETFRGILVPLVRPHGVFSALKLGFEQMNISLKELCENSNSLKSCMN